MNSSSAYRQRLGSQGSIMVKAVCDNSYDYSTALKDLEKEYIKTGEAVEVDFRELVSFDRGINRYTHLMHPYPAKLLAQIPHFFINCSALSKKNDLVLDPFCGSGTVLLEAIIAGRNAAGADSNPLARLLSRTKTTSFYVAGLKKTFKKIVDNIDKNDHFRPPQNILDWKHWYSPKTKKQLENLSFCIEEFSPKAHKDFFQLCFSCCVRKTSLADPKVSVPVKLNPDRYTDFEYRKKIKHQVRNLKNCDVFESFSQIVEANINRIIELKKVSSLGEVKTLMNDSRDLSLLEDCSVDLIVTSPPYTGAQKYIRSSSLNIGWLNLSPDGTLRSLEKQNIGREHYSKSEYQSLTNLPNVSAKPLIEKIFKKNKLRAHIAAQYLVEMEDAFKESYRVLKKNKHLVLVIGNNVVCGYDFETRQYLKEICEQIGFKTKLVLRDNICSRGLMTKRNKTASIISCEWIMVLKK